MTEKKKAAKGLRNKNADDSDDSHEDDFNPNLKVQDGGDDESDEEESEETKAKKAQAKKLNEAKALGDKNIFDRMDAEQTETFTAQGAAVINALAGGKTRDLSRFIATREDDDDEASEEKDEGKNYMVNPLLFGREDRSDEYGAIFGKDLEWFPNGLRVWRMERFLPKPVAPNVFGKFLTKETYLILNIEETEDGGKVATISYWLGSETTMDKSGGAAFRIGELAGFLQAMSKVNEIPCKFRQRRYEEGHEDDDLRNLFDAATTNYGGFHVEQGGTASEFNKVEQDFGAPQLYLVQADDHSREMALEPESLNRKHAFLLDEGKVIWVWHGANATYFDRFKAVELASKLANKDRMGRSRVLQVEDDDNESKNPTVDFWKRFGLARPPSNIRDEFVAYTNPKYRIWRTQNVDGKFDLLELTERPLAKSMLKSQHCVIFDAFYTVYCWKGTRSSPLERAASELLAQKFLSELAERPKWARIRSVLESAEPELFKEKFGDWKDEKLDEVSRNVIADSAPPPTIDVQTLLEEAYWDPKLLDDASGTIEAWVITGRGPKFEKLPEKERGIFWNQSCYMVLYSYTAKDEDGDPVQRYRVYFWQGSKAGEQWYPQFMFGFFPVLEKRIKSQGRFVDQVKIHQGSEPKHFCMLFGSLLVIRNGARQEPAGPDDPLRSWQKKPVMFDTRLQMPSEIVRAIEPEKISAAFLHSEGTFVIVNDSSTYIWIGKASRLFPSAEAMKTLLLRVARGGTTQLMEGDESDAPEFWDVIGGPGKYCKKDRRSHWVPRLFEGYAQDGQLRMREIVNFSQADLSEQQSYLLDAYDKLYVWYGKQCSETMKQSSILVGNTYIRLAATVREMFVGLEMFQSGSEPLEFQYMFHTWMPRTVSNEEKTVERRELRLHRLMLLEYRRTTALEKNERRARLALKFNAMNLRYTQHNLDIRAKDEEITRHNAKIEASKKDDAEFEKKKLDREKARLEKEAEHLKELEEMEKERERKRLEREARRKAEEEEEAKIAEELAERDRKREERRKAEEEGGGGGGSGDAPAAE